MYFMVASGARPRERFGSATRQRAQDHERLGAARNGGGQGGIGQLVRQIFAAREETHERAPLLRDVIADRAAQHRKARLERVERRALRDRVGHVEQHLTRGPRERAQIGRQYDADHRSVWTSTDSTGGRSRTIAVQWSPASGDTYTWPPLVPK